MRILCNSCHSCFAVSRRPSLPDLDHARWWLDGHCGQWEILAHSIFKHDRLELIRDAEMHNCIVPESLHLRMIPLGGGAPEHFTYFMAVGASPIIETLKMCKHPLCLMRADAIDKSIAETGSALEIHGQVEEVVAARKTLLVEQFHELLTRQVVWNVADHQSSLGLRLVMSPCILGLWRLLGRCLILP